MLLVRSLLLWSSIHFSMAQNVPVNCTAFNFSNCTTRTSLTEVPYSTCCTLTGDIRFVDQSGSCSRCGPVLDQEAILPTQSAGSTVIISWKLKPGSITATSFGVTGRPVNSSASVLPIRIPGNYFTASFPNQIEGVEYVYMVTAFGGGVASPPVQITWTAGRNLGPTLGNFGVTDVTLETAEVEWELVYNGLDPALNMTLMWDTDGRFLENSTNMDTITFDEALDDGTVLNYTFVDLDPGTRYALRIAASNKRHTTFSTLFTFTTNTSDFVVGTTAGLSSAVMAAVVTPVLCMMTVLTSVLVLLP